jgi:hypothetical protein
MDGPVSELGLGNATALVLLEEGVVSKRCWVLRLGELILSLVVPGIVLLLFSGRVHLKIGPGIKGSSPIAAWLNSQVVDTTHDSEETLFSPVRAPWVTDVPELNTVFLTEANDRYLVNGMKVTSGIIEDSTNVVIEFLSDCDRTSERSSLDELVQHGLFTVDMAVLVYFVNVVLFRDEASLARFTIAAHGHSAAIVTVTFSLVNRAGLISDVVFVNPLVPVVRVSTVTASIFILAWDKNLGWDVNIGPLGLTSDFDSIGEGWGGSMSPTWSAVLRNMLVANVGQVVDSINVAPVPRLGEFLKHREFLSNVKCDVSGRNVAGCVVGDSFSVGSSYHHCCEWKFHIK